MHGGSVLETDDLLDYTKICSKNKHPVSLHLSSSDEFVPNVSSDSGTWLTRVELDVDFCCCSC